MTRRLGLVLLAGYGCWLAATSEAAAQNCAAIQDAAQRLACYDRGTRGAAPAPASPPVGTAPLQGTPVIVGPPASVSPSAAVPVPPAASAPAAIAPAPVYAPPTATACGGERDSGRRLACFDRQPSAACSHLQSPGARLTCYDQQGTGATAVPPPDAAPAAAPPIPAPRAAAVPPRATGRGPEVETDPRMPHPGELRPLAPTDRAYDPLGRPPPADPRLYFSGTRDERRLPGVPPDPAQRVALVAVRIGAISEYAQRWEVTVSVVNQSQRVIDPQVDCQLTRFGAVIATIPLRLVGVAPGHTVVLQAIGPSVLEYYVDGANCRVVGPLI